MSSRLRSGLTIFALLILSLIAIFAMHQYLRYLDEDTTSGEAHGLAIGDSKREVFGKMRAAFQSLGFSEENVFVEVKADEAMAFKLGISEGRHVMVKVDLESSGFLNLSGTDVWEFYNNGSYQDFIRLSFCGGYLCRIYRHRKDFELP